MSAPPAAAPSGAVTFLFTDVEGSTRRWEADADAMRVALAAHDEVLRKAIQTHGGWLFKHTGDGVCAAFASPRSAVDAAVTAQRALELPVRMGLATGEAELRGGDYFGAVLNRAARVMAAGHGGQILVADSTAGLLSAVDLVDLGPRRLRDVPTPVQVFQVQAEGLRTDFPPLRALDTSPGNLRSAATSFIGREPEVAEVHAAVKAHRLVTLTGVGGVGKTRLALEVAARLVDEFPDGVWFFELAAVTDPAAVPDAVAAVLSITQQPGKSVSESVASALEGRLRLLVFDNCEHVVDSVADLVEAILAASATVSILATSREGLGVIENYEPIAWAEVLIEPAHAVDHPRLAFLYAMAALCWIVGRIEEAVRYADAAQRVIDSGGGEMPFGTEGWLGGAHVAIGQPERSVELCRAQLAHGRDTHGLTMAALVLALTLAGSHDEAMAVGRGLIDAAEATRNPWALSFALFTYGFAFSDADSVRALDALRRGLVIAQDSGNRANESFLAVPLARAEAKFGDPLAALEHATLAIRNHHDSGNDTLIRLPLINLAVFLDRLGRFDSAATIAGFAFSPLTAASFPEINTTIAHLRVALGDQTYESLARKGETMTTAAVVTYAYNQIDQARTELEHLG